MRGYLPWHLQLFACPYKSLAGIVDLYSSFHNADRRMKPQWLSNSLRSAIRPLFGCGCGFFVAPHCQIHPQPLVQTSAYSTAFHFNYPSLAGASSLFFCRHLSNLQKPVKTELPAKTDRFRICRFRLCRFRLCKFRLCRFRLCRFRLYRFRLCRLRLCRFRLQVQA